MHIQHFLGITKRDPEKIHQLKAVRKSILKEMNKKVKDIKEKRAEELVNEIETEIETAKDNNRMFKAVKALYTKHKRIHFVHDENE